MMQFYLWCRGSMLDEVPDLVVDCEYNRDLNEKKVIPIAKEIVEKMLKDENPTPEDLSVLFTNEPQTRVFPDIIVHARGTNQNIVVIEAKKARKAGSVNTFAYRLAKKWDEVRLDAYKGCLGYTEAAHVVLKAGYQKLSGDSLIGAITWR